MNLSELIKLNPPKTVVLDEKSSENTNPIPVAPEKSVLETTTSPFVPFHPKLVPVKKLLPPPEDSFQIPPLEEGYSSYSDSEIAPPPLTLLPTSIPNPMQFSERDYREDVVGQILGKTSKPPKPKIGTRMTFKEKLAPKSPSSLIPKFLVPIQSDLPKTESQTLLLQYFWNLELVQSQIKQNGMTPTVKFDGSQSDPLLRIVKNQKLTLNYDARYPCKILLYFRALEDEKRRCKFSITVEHEHVLQEAYIDCSTTGKLRGSYRVYLQDIGHKIDFVAICVVTSMVLTHPFSIVFISEKFRVISRLDKPSKRKRDLEMETKKIFTEESVMFGIHAPTIPPSYETFHQTTETMKQYPNKFHNLSQQDISDKVEKMKLKKLIPDGQQK